MPAADRPPHRHEFGEWFHVLEGSLAITTAEDGGIVALCTAEAGDSVWGSQVRFLVVGVPGTMTEYFAEAGIEVPNEDVLPSTEPPGPAELGDLPRRHGITFFPG
jgi:hypothetical protein